MGFAASRGLLDSWLVNIKPRLKAGRSSPCREVVLEQEAGFLPQLQLLLYNMVNGDGDREGHRAQISQASSGPPALSFYSASCS